MNDQHNTNIVVVGLIHKADKIFIARRAKTKPTFPDQFELIGGHLERGESIEDGLKREIHEELSIDVEVGSFVDAFTYESEGVFKVELCYLCRPVNDSQDPVLNFKDHSEASWINKDEISQFGKEDEETVALRKAFKILEGEE